MPFKLIQNIVQRGRPNVCTFKKNSCRGLGIQESNVDCDEKI
jgi:hypothetical protein